MVIQAVGGIEAFSGGIPGKIGGLTSFHDAEKGRLRPDNVL